MGHLSINTQQSNLLSLSVLVKLSEDVGEDVMHSLLKMFITELEGIQNTFNNAPDKESILAALHTLKNSAALYGAKKLSDVATQFHDYFPAEEKEVTDALCQVRVLCKCTHNAYEQYYIQLQENRGIKE